MTGVDRDRRDWSAKIGEGIGRQTWASLEDGQQRRSQKNENQPACSTFSAAVDHPASTNHLLSVMPLALNKLMPYSDNPPCSPSPTNFDSPPHHHPAPTSSSAQLRMNKAQPHGPSRFRWRRWVRSLVMKSHRLRIPAQISRDGSGDRSLPLKIRPAFCIFSLITLVLLAIIGFHPSVHPIIPIPNKLFHFFGFALITGLFYSIPEVEDNSRYIWYWNYFNEILTGVVCFGLGGLGTELVQLLLPWKMFAWGDILANELGCLVGYQLARSLHRQYRHKLELSKLYEPLASSRSPELSDEEDEDHPGKGPTRMLFGGNSTELSNVWSDRLEEGNEYFRFEDDEES